MSMPTLRLAPMAGISDWPFRLLCFEQGCDAAYTEMVSAMGTLCAAPGNIANTQLLKTHPAEGPLYVQIFGKEPELMARAAQKMAGMQLFQGIDINMGCPAHKVAGSGEGSGLMKQPQLAARIMDAVRKTVLLPISVKMRLGWDEDTINVLELAHIAQENGMSAVAVHGRTRTQQYSGKADWDWIARVKQSISIPVYGNGDVCSGEDVLHMLDYTGCDGVLIGRGAMGNPWIFSEAKALLRGEKAMKPSLTARVETALRHAQMMVAWKGEAVAVREMRKHVSWYISGTHGASQMRAKANQAKTQKELEDALLSWADMNRELHENSL